MLGELLIIERPPSRYKATFVASRPVMAIETRSLPTLTRSYPRRFTFYVADPLSSIRRALAAAMRADLAAIEWSPRISRDRQGLSLAIRHSRALAETEAVFSVRAATHRPRLRFQSVCSCDGRLPREAEHAKRKSAITRDANAKTRDACAPRSRLRLTQPPLQH